MKVLLACTGSVATIKVSEIAEKLQERNHEIQIVPTTHALHFLNRETLNCKVYTDDDEWNLWKGRGDPVLHIELKRWADILLIAPLDANTLAKMAQVMKFSISCLSYLNLLTCVLGPL